MQLEGLADDEVLRVDSNRKGELKPEEWKVLRERLIRRGPAQEPARHRQRAHAARRLRREQYLRDRAVARIERRHPSGADDRPGPSPHVRGNEYDDISVRTRQLIRAARHPPT